MKRPEETIAAILRPPISEKRESRLGLVLVTLALAAPVVIVLALAGCSGAASDRPGYSYAPGKIGIAAGAH